MSCQERFHSQLQERGGRNTRQRAAVLEAVHELPAPATAEEIHREAVRLYPGIKLSTVYRALDLFRSLGLISVVGLEGKLHRYLHVGTEKPHFHLRCRACGVVIGADLEEIQDLASRLRTRHGFDVDLSQLTVPGLCQDCR